MQKKIIVILFLLSLFPALPAAQMSSYFPDIAGWAKKEGPSIYGPDNLYEYIDGAAENFLNYDFQDLVMLTYEDQQKHTLTVEIYRHRSPETAFGIYSSEKPLKGNYFPVGTEGYYEDGVFNFYAGPYYVKMSSFDLSGRDKALLLDVGNKISDRIGRQPGAPAALAIFPPEGKIVHSERFVLKNFLGHPFLHSGFVADYEKQGKKFQVFLIRADGEEEARSMEKQFLAAAPKSGTPPVPAVPSGFTDPYNGKVLLIRQKSFIAGTLNAPEAEAAACLKEIENRLKTLDREGKTE
jgi:hypothetical protein